MQHIGVGIMYIILGVGQYKLIHLLNLNSNKTSLLIGRTLYYSGIIITISSFLTLLPFIPKIFSTYVLAITVLIMVIIVLKAVKEFQLRMHYDSVYFLETAINKDKKGFEEGFTNHSEIITSVSSEFEQSKLFLVLTHNGLLEEWLDDKTHLFDEEVLKKYKSFLIRDLLSKNKNKKI